jgi:tape measure domain-containing protein
MASPLKLEVIIGAVDKITAPIAAMNRKIEASLAPVRKLQLGLSGLTRELGIGKLKTAASGAVSSLGRVGSEAGKLTAKFAAAAGIAGYAFKRGFVDIAATFERYQMQLETMEGSSEGARKSMDWVRHFAKSTPLELEEVMGSFVRLRTFGMDPMDGTMQSLVDQNAKMGGSGADLEGMVLAVGKAWTKQKLAGEEAMQLIQRGVPVWDLLAKRTGIAATKLQELSSKGKLGRGAIKMLVEEMGKSSAGAAEKQARTWTGMVSMISDYWSDFAMRVMDSGLFTWMRDELQGFLGMLDKLAADGSLDKLAKDFGEKLKVAFVATKDVMIAVASVAKDVAAALKWLHDLFGSWKPVIVAVVAIIAGPLLLAMAVATKAIIVLGGALMGTLLLAIAAATKAVVVFGIALMATPVGWVIAAVAAIAAAAYLIIKNWDQVKEWFWKFTPLGIIIKNWAPVGEFFAGLWDGIGQVFRAVMDGIVAHIEWVANKVGKVVDFGRWVGSKISGSDPQAGGTRTNAATTGQQAGGTRTTAPTINRGQGARAEVSGEIKISIDANGRPRVEQAKSGPNSPALAVNTGMAMAY